MEFRTYEKGGQIIHATETAFNALYKGQGFVLKTEEDPKPPPKEVVSDEGTDGNGKGSGDPSNNSESASVGKSKKAKS